MAECKECKSPYGHSPSCGYGLLEAENARLIATRKDVRQDINDYGLDDFEETTNDTLAKIDAVLGLGQGPEETK